jgi:hypothetical protein
MDKEPLLFKCFKSRDTNGKTVLDIRHVFDISARLFTPMSNLRVTADIQAEMHVGHRSFQNYD